MTYNFFFDPIEIMSKNIFNVSGNLYNWFMVSIAPEEANFRAILTNKINLFIIIQFSNQNVLQLFHL